MDINANDAYSTVHDIHIGMANPGYYDDTSNAYAYPVTSPGPLTSLPPLVKTGSGDYAKIHPGAEYYNDKDNDASSGIYEQIHPQPYDEEDLVVENPLYGSVD